MIRGKHKRPKIKQHEELLTDPQYRHIRVKDKKKEEKYNPSKRKLMEELREGLDYLYEERIKENMK